jgi:hypothetical protein
VDRSCSITTHLGSLCFKGNYILAYFEGHEYLKLKAADLTTFTYHVLSFSGVKPESYSYVIYVGRPKFYIKKQ